LRHGIYPHIRGGPKGILTQNGYSAEGILTLSEGCIWPRPSHRAYRCDAPASRCQHRGGWTTRVSAPYIDSTNSSVGALSAVKCPSRYPRPWDCLGFGHRRAAGSSRALHLMRLRVVLLLARLLLLLLLLLLPLPLPGSVRLGGTTHSSSTAGIVGLCCALPCLALLHRYELGLLQDGHHRHSIQAGAAARVGRGGKRPRRTPRSCCLRTRRLRHQRRGLSSHTCACDRC
jgi:hypothetical protein